MAQLMWRHRVHSDVTVDSFGNATSDKTFGYFHGLTLVCTACNSGQVSAQTTTKSNTNSKAEMHVVAEENLGSIERRLGTTAVVFAGNFDIGARVILWRNLTDDGVGRAVAHISFGSWAKDGFAVTFSGKDFSEDAFVQFTIEDCRNLVRLIERLDSVKFLEPGEEIKHLGVLRMTPCRS